MRRIGIVSFSSPGHYYPLTALGWRLQSRGHEEVYFQVADLERPIRAAGLEFYQIGAVDLIEETFGVPTMPEAVAGLRFSRPLWCGSTELGRSSSPLQ